MSFGLADGIGTALQGIRDENEQRLGLSVGCGAKEDFFMRIEQRWRGMSSFSTFDHSMAFRCQTAVMDPAPPTAGRALHFGVHSIETNN